MKNPPTNVKFCIDNTTVIDRVKTLEWQQHQPPKTTADECKSLYKLHTLHKKLQKITVHHVKGHQTGKNLSWPAQLNKGCDHLARKARNFPNINECKLNTTSDTVINKDVESPSVITMFLRQAHTSQNIRECMNKKYKWGKAANNVDWMVHSRELKLLPHKHKKTNKKFAHEWLPVNGHKGVQTNTKICPICKTKAETQHHFLWCNHAKCQATQSKAGKNFSTNIKQFKGDPAMVNLIVQSSLKSNTNKVKDQPKDNRCRHIIKQQNK